MEYSDELKLMKHMESSHQALELNYEEICVIWEQSDLIFLNLFKLLWFATRNLSMLALKDFPAAYTALDFKIKKQEIFLIGKKRFYWEEQKYLTEMLIKDYLLTDKFL